MNGQLILHYHVLDQLGAGGMGVVYRAVDSRLGRMVALKFLPESASLDAAAKERLIGEARAAAKLDHPNIGVIYSIEDVEQRPFIVMALYQGQDLRARISAGPLSVTDALDVAIQTAQGLARAHGSGIVHRDIKPENLFITDQNMVKILDFGLAKHDEISGLTSHGAIMGTLPYMSPEQVRGQAVDHRADLWALGVVLYEMLSGFSPFVAEGGMAAAILKIIKNEPQAITELRPDVPRRIEDVLERALAKDLDYRYSSAQELVADLEASKTKGIASTEHAPPPSPTHIAEPAPHVEPKAAPLQSALVSSEPASVLPTPSTPLVGRQDELAIIATHLEDPHCRMLTLFGPGGTGKTRLVLEAAQQQLEGGRYKDGVFFVPLDALSDAGLIPGAIAKVLGMTPQGQEPVLEQVIRHIGAHSMLLILDNYEHVMDGAHLPSELVQSCPNLKILVTSRERLSLDEEWVLPVLGLSVPETEAVTAEKAQRYDSVQLFIHRAKRASLRFSLEDENPADICRICQLVDGSPLAIELAAAWVKMMPCAEIVKEIQANLDFLASSSRNITERHRSIRATFEYSWCLLNPKEQEALRKLSVFSGGFEREAASEVVGASLPVLASLVDKSLLRSSNGRYDRHPLLYRYTQEKLSAHPKEYEEAHEKHLAYFLALAEEAEPQLQSREQARWLARLEAEHDNLRSALRWALEHADGVTAARLGGATWRFWHVRGYLNEGRDWLEQALTLLEPKASDGAAIAARAKALKGAGVLAWAQGEHGRATTLFEEGLAIVQDLGNKVEIAAFYNNLAVIAIHQGDYARAIQLLEASLVLRREQGDLWGVATCLNNLGATAGTQGDNVQAQRYYQESLALYRQLGNKTGVALTLSNLGDAAMLQGNPEQAYAFYAEALAVRRDIGDKVGTAASLARLGAVALRQGRVAEAQSLYSESLTLLWEMGDKERIADNLRGFAAIAAAQRQLVRAAYFWGAAESLRETIGTPLAPGERSEVEREVAAVRAQFGEAAFAPAWQQGRAMPLEEVVALALASPHFTPAASDDSR